MPADNQLIFDVGMHKGEDTAFYLRKGFRVVAFEADPDLAQACRRRFPKEIASGLLTIVEGAICEPGAGDPLRRTVTFYRNVDNSVWGTVDSNWAGRNEYLGTKNQKIEVPIVDFGQCLRQYGTPHYLKIDIEGMDRLCLKALTTIEGRPNYISIEAEKVNFDQLLEEFEILSELGYTRFKAVQQSGISTQHEPNPPAEGRFANQRFAEGSSGLFGADLPGHWQDRPTILAAYRRIFWLYRLFGDRALLPRFAVGRLLIKVLMRLFKRPIPGWFDTHARHHSVVSASTDQHSRQVVGGR